MPARIGFALRSAARRVDKRALAAFGVPFILYLLTLAPTVYNLDSAELTTAAATGGLVRATGYPLYLILGNAWARLPIGDVGYRLNLFSAFSGALTLLLADRLLRQWRVGAWAAFAALGLLTSATAFWAMSLIAEVYTLHTALMAGLLLALLRWGRQPDPRRLALVGLLLGLGLSHHLATVLLLPGCAWYVLTTAPRSALAPRSLAWALAGLLLGLSPYLYLPLRYAAQPAFNYAGHYDASGVFHPVNLRSLAGLVWLVSGRSFAGQMFAYPPAALWRETLNYAAELWRAFFAIGLGPGLLGLALLLRRDWRLGGTLLLMFAASAAFYIDYQVADKALMFLPTYLVWALWVGVGVQWLLDLVGEHGRAQGLLRGLLAAAVLLAIGWNWRLVDLSGDWSARQRGQAILHEAAPGALVLGYWHTVPIVEYLQFVEGQRPDVRAINRFMMSPEALQELALREAPRRPVYIDSVPAGLLAVLKVEPAGPLYRLSPAGGR